MVLLALTVALVMQGYLRHLYGVSEDAAAPPGRADKVPSALAHGGPVIDARGGTPRTAGPAPGVLALTFDDGPDPTWTPKVLEVLRRHHVHATFFLVGTQALDHPELVAKILADGHEIGLHTLTHVDLGAAPAWQRHLELREAQQVLVGLTGQTTALLRPPFSSENGAIDNAMLDSMLTAASDGYVSVLATRDGEDWRRPGVEAIVHGITPPGRTGEVVLLHDAGGDRSQTVAALDRALPALSAKGYRFETVSQSVGMASAMSPASAVDRLTGLTLVWVLRLSDLVIAVIGACLVASGFVVGLRAVLVIGAAARHHRGRLRERRRGAEPVLEPVSVIVPAYNESAGIEAAVRSIVASTHPVEVIVVDDGSTDGTADLVESLHLPGVTVIRQVNGGKPSALNTGLRHASHDLVVMVDGDTVFEPDAVYTLVQRFADPRVGAVSGNTKVANRGGILGRWQHIEYVIGFNLDRRLFDIAECMPTVPGAIGGFRRSALERVGGVSDDTLAEDTDLTMALSRDGWRVVYEDGARAWTEAPASLGALWRQRYRWCYGTLQAMWKHRGALTQSGAAGKLGRRGLTYLLVLQVLLPLLAPAVDVFAVYGLVFLDATRVTLVWLAFLAIQAVMAVYAFRLDGESLRPMWSLPLQQVVYRQLMYLVVIQSVFTALAGTYLRWHRMERYGSLRVPAPEPAAAPPR
ncbi:bifunctional polysaccharide deacetylase/glycosyltransferase family 2 protein [Terrabacter sp. GCM10028922]|uniref:bifunctional polysaccharide deacetylase/glycosyltransferase family 2 protein n=1 Tax=Terrabacter sp. GCM10028922 TaxID=3273428 RepID=UPI003619CFB6